MLGNGEGEGGVQLVRKAPTKITSLECVSLFTSGCRSCQKSFLLESYLVSVKNCMIPPAEPEARLFWLQAWELVCLCIYINILYTVSQLSLACEGPAGDTT